MQKTLKYCILFLLIGFVVLTFAAPPTVKADPLPQPVIELFGPASIEQITKTSEILMATNDMFNQIQNQTNAYMAQFKLFAAYTGNQKLIEIANSDPLSVIRTPTQKWLQDFNTNISNKIIEWLTKITTKKTAPDPSDYSEKMNNDINRGVNNDLGLPDPKLSTGDKEQDRINEVVIKRNKFVNVSEKIRSNYFVQTIDLKTGKVTDYPPSQYPFGSTPKFLSDHQIYLSNIENLLKSSEYQNSTNPTIQQEITNQLLMEIAQSNLKILQAMQDLVKTQYLTNSITQEKAIDDAYNQLEMNQTN